MAKKQTSIIEVNEASFRGLVYHFRGVPVMLDSDLAEIYGYTTKAFNQQVKNNIERFDEEDMMFQLTEEETSQLSRSKILTMNEDGVLKPKTLRGQNLKYRPYVFTEQGVYMLMSVLKGELAVKQSKALVRMFKLMKDYILQNQPLLGQREFLQLSLQTSDNLRDIMELRSDLSRLDEKVAKMADEMGEVVTHSELSNVMLDFSSPVEEVEVQITGNGIHIYSQAC